MRRLISILFLILPVVVAWQVAWAREATNSGRLTMSDTVMINFRQSKWNLDRSVGQNAESLDRIDEHLSKVFDDSVFRLQRVEIYGGASPEGSVKFNKFLSEQRAKTLFSWFDKYSQLSGLDKSFTFYGRDWEGVLAIAEKDERIPYRRETLELLRSIVNEKKSAGGAEPKQSLERIKRLRGGVPYRYLYRYIFPAVRASKVIVFYDKIPATPPRINTDTVAQVPDTVYVDRVVRVTDTIYYNSCPKRPFYMDVRSNMLYDALALPNVGIEFYLGKNFSLGANWMYAWWKSDKRHRYWRAYGGEVFGRWWFGKKAKAKPLTGHHLGLYGQLYTYDFEWGGEGEMGGQPGGNLWDRNFWSVGAEYGYSLPVGRRINIDFTIGVGYTTGIYHKYVPMDNCYVWKSTHRRHYFGPTKLEIALVWLIGRGNINKRKGGGK